MLRPRGRKVSLLILSLIGLALPAGAAPSFTVQGRITRSDGTLLESAGMEFKVAILSPTNEQCILYEETFTNKDMTGSKGLFSLTIGNTSGARSDTYNSWSMTEAFANLGSFVVSSAHCGSGSGMITYTPGANDERRVLISFKEPLGSWEQMPVASLSHSPYSMQARQIAGFGADALCRVADAGVPQNVAALTSANFTELVALINGTSTQYLTKSATTGSLLPQTAGTTPGSAVEGSVWYDSTNHVIKYKDNSGVQTVGTSTGSVTSISTGAGLTGGPITQTGTISLANSGVTAASYGTATKVPTIAVDATGRITTAGETSITGLLPSGNSGEVLKYSGSAWSGALLALSDLKSSAVGHPSLFDMSTACSANKTLSYDSIGDRYTCVDIGINGSQITTGTVASARLPANAAAWELNSSKLYYNGGNVGIGTGNPYFKLQVSGGPIERTGTDYNNTSTGSNIYLHLGAETGNTFGILGTATNGGTIPGKLAIMPYGGSVGIGTTNPAASLHVYGDTKSDGLLIEGSTSFRKFRNVATFSIGSVVVPGAFVIQTNIPMTTAAMFRMQIDGYRYNANNAFSFQLGGYAYSSPSFINIGVTNVSSWHPQIRYARNTVSGNMAVIIGDEAASYSYLRFTVASVETTGGPISDFSMMKGWTITQATALTDFDTVTNVPETAVLGGLVQSNLTGMNWIGGSLGIGTNNPSNTLSIKSSATATGGLKFESSSGADADRLSIFPEGNSSTVIRKLNANAVLSFQNSSGTPEVIIANNGFVGIGTVAPKTKLDIVDSGGAPSGSPAFPVRVTAGTGNPGFIYERTDASRFVSAWTGTSGAVLGFSDGSDRLAIGTYSYANRYSSAYPTTEIMSLKPGGSVGIGTSSPQAKLHVNGTLRVESLNAATATQVCIDGDNVLSACSSSIRYKENVLDLDLSLETILKLRPVSYDWKKSKEHDVGFIAEEVEKVDPRLVTYNKDGQIQGVKYDQLASPIVRALQEIYELVTGTRDEVKRLKETNALQEQTIQDLRSRLERIERRLGSE